MPALSLYVGKLQEGTKFEIFSEGIKIRKLSERMYRKNVILGLKILTIILRFLYYFLAVMNGKQ